LAPGGYNLKEGGGSNGKWSEKSKQKMSESHLGKTLSEEHRQNISKSLIGIPRTDETKQKISESHRGEKSYMYGKPKSEETRQKISEAKKGEKNPRSKRVYQYDLEGNLLGSFASTGDAMRKIDNGSKISECARGNPRYKTVGGFKWSYNKI
jgi:group I intron endonuclease